MNSNKKTWIWIVGAIILVALFAIWYFDVLNLASKTGLPAIKKATYQSKDDDYSITYTNNWKQLTTDELVKKQVDFDTAFINKKNENVVIGINKPIAKDQPYEIDLEKSLEILKTGLTEQYKDKSFTVTDLSSGKNNAIPYLSITYVLDDVKQIQRFYITDDKLYIIVASAPKDIFEKFANDINHFFESYKLSQ